MAFRDTRHGTHFACICHLARATPLHGVCRLLELHECEDWGIMVHRCAWGRGQHYMHFVHGAKTGTT